jgi:hypothetical protein
MIHTPARTRTIGNCQIDKKSPISASKGTFSLQGSFAKKLPKVGKSRQQKTTPARASPRGALR